MSSAELILSTQLDNVALVAATVWDSNTGNQLKHYKNGGNVAHQTLALLPNNYVLTADRNKPLLHIWPINSQDQDKNIRLVLPDCARAISVCGECAFLAAGIGLKLYLWQISSGKLLCVRQKHYQPITCVRFHEDYLVVAGEDGMVVVYSTSELASDRSGGLLTEGGQVEPLYTRNDHSMAVSDLKVNNFGFKSRFVTVSLDQSAKLYELATGTILLSIVFPEPLTAVTACETFHNLYVGTNVGTIYNYNLISPPRTLVVHVENVDNKFLGHTKQVNSLAISQRSNTLISGSNDNFVIIWNIASRQVLKKIEHKSSVTNVRFFPPCANFQAQNFKPTLVFKSLERNIETDSYKNTLAVIQQYDIEYEDKSEEVVEVGGKVLEKDLRKVKALNTEMYCKMIELLKRRNIEV